MENNDIDDETRLDISWINEQSRIQNIQQNYFKEPMENINAYYLFINKNSYIDNIKCEKLSVELAANEQYHHISPSTILKIIQTNKTNKLTTQYKLKEILTYINDTNPEDIQSFVDTNKLDVNDSTGFLQKHTNLVDEIKIPESIFIFHNVNSAYFIFHETTTETHNYTYKSILKTSSRENKPNITKKVRIQDKNHIKPIPNQIKQPPKHKYTRKHNKHNIPLKPLTLL